MSRCNNIMFTRLHKGFYQLYYIPKRSVRKMSKLDKEEN